MDVQITRSNDIWQYDPSIDGYTDDTVFKTISGTPAISAGKLRLSNAEIISKSAFRNSNLEINMTIPTAPTAGDVRQFGFKLYNDGLDGRTEFDIADTVFSAKLYDRDGTIISAKVINWSSAWTAAEAKYGISVSETNVFFKINNTIVAKFEYSKDLTTKYITKNPLSIHFDNNLVDNLDITSISVF